MTAKRVKPEKPTWVAALSQRLEKIEKLKEQIAAKRDELREAVSDVEDIIDSLNDGVDELEYGLRSLNNAVDKCSELL